MLFMVCVARFFQENDGSIYCTEEAHHAIMEQKQDGALFSLVAMPG